MENFLCIYQSGYSGLHVTEIPLKRAVCLVMENPSGPWYQPVSLPVSVSEPSFPLFYLRSRLRSHHFGRRAPEELRFSSVLRPDIRWKQGWSSQELRQHVEFVLTRVGWGAPATGLGGAGGVANADWSGEPSNHPAQALGT